MAKRKRTPKFYWLHPAAQTCLCANEGKDGTTNHGEPVARITSAHNSTEIDGKIRVFVTCENHLHVYLQNGFRLVSLNQEIR